MQQLEFENGSNALVVAAHPDDETIWMGGTIARQRNVRWTIFVLCRKSDPDRMPKFMRVAKHYGARGIICDLEDEGILNITQSIPEIQKRIRKELPKATWDIVFTHGANGEYGHERHKAVHLAVKEMMERGGLRARESFFFSYRLDEHRKIAVPAFSVKGADSAGKARFYVELSNAEWKIKRDVIKKLYGFTKMSFENRSCASQETFTKML